MFHVWISTDSEDHDSCLVCGGTWAVTDDGHEAANGDMPNPCTRNTSQCHHYSGECNITDGSPCQLDPECNCLFCA